jgi:phosphopentomutase
MTATAAGKDSTTGHWELAGVILKQPFPLYPDGFPKVVINAFCHEANVAGILGNRADSGTVIIDEFGEEHQRSGKPIVYTSGDSVFQIATHVETIPLEELYRLCKVARDRVCVGEHAVGRVIARPFEGEVGDYERLSYARKDFSLKPPERTLQEILQDAGVRTVSVGKIASLFGGVGFDEDIKTKGNADGIDKALEAIQTATQSPVPTFIWINLVDFDELYGHRNNPQGFAQALEYFDQRLPELVTALPEDACFLLTADHGNDPAFPGTDHTRERVPLLFYKNKKGRGRNIGTRSTFADHAATVADYFGVEYSGPGTSFG